MNRRRPSDGIDLGGPFVVLGIALVVSLVLTATCSCSYAGPPLEWTGVTVGVAHSEGEFEESGSPNNFHAGTDSNTAYAELHFEVVDVARREKEEARWERQGLILARLAADRPSESREPPEGTQGRTETTWYGQVLETLENHPMGVMVLVFLVGMLVLLGFRGVIAKRLGGEPDPGP